MTTGLAQIGATVGYAPYPISRLVYTLLFMVFVLGTAVFVVRRTSTNRLFSQLVTTLGVFLLIIGTIVYTVAFRGLQLVEMILSWSISVGAIYWFLGSMNRIARRETELRLAAIKESETRFQAIIESAAEVISIVDFDGVIRYISPAVTRVLGVSPEAVQGKTFFDLMQPDNALVARLVFKELAGQPGNVRSDEARFRQADGSWRTVALTAKNLENVRGIDAIVVNARDITQQKALETELRQAQRMETIGQLAGPRIVPQRIARPSPPPPPPARPGAAAPPPGRRARRAGAAQSDSARSSRSIRSPIARRAGRPSNSTRFTARTIGISTPARSASASALRAVTTPSATVSRPARTSASVWPRPMASPTARFRLSAPVHVSTDPRVRRAPRRSMRAPRARPRAASSPPST